MKRQALLVALCAALRVSAVFAQDVHEPDPEKVRMRIGPLLLNPTISVSNVGVDNNVFNEPEDRDPKRDFTMTLTPATDLWLRIGPSWLTGNIKEDIVWFQTYASERAANSSYALGWRVPMNRVVLNTAVTYLNTRDRPGFEIDARSQRNEFGYKGSLELRAFSRTSLVVNASRLRVDFDKDSVFQESHLQFELNRVSTAVGGGIAHQITDLTTLSFNVSRFRDTFEFSPLRDSISNVAAVGVTFNPAALIKGSATIGYRDFKPVSSDLVAFKGPTAAANLTYTLLGITRFAVLATRDVQYSYDINQPYYLLTGAEFSVAQQIFGPFDLVGRIGRQTLAYQERAGAAVEVTDRVDRVRSYGGGLGYHLGKELRLGVNVDSYQRSSGVLSRQYDDLRIGSSLTYGF